MNNLGLVFAILGAAFAAGFSSVGSARGMGIAAEAGAGLTTEKPELFSKAVILELLPVLQGIFGLITAVVVLFEIGLFNGNASLSWDSGLAVFASCLPVGLVGFFSAVFEGRVAASGISMIAKDNRLMGKAVGLTLIIKIVSILSFALSLVAVLFVIK